MVGIVFTEIPTEEVGGTAEIIVTKIRSLLSTCLSAERASVIRLTMQAFPEDWGADGSGGASGKAGPIEEIPRSSDKKVQQLVKRGLDIVGSAVALALSLPLLIAIAIVIKCTSKGPILFRQMRVGQYGQKFMFLKFRSMHTKNDSAIHQEFVKQLITRKADPKTTQDKSAGAAQAGVYKLTADPRITPIGRLLRRTSLDELPQFLNVLLGEMSLVGPRPPIPYEVACYDIWHRRRLLAVKPGITGLWQVCGRSRTTFDEMVRLDLKYARTWSVWMDIQILLRTPRAMMSGEGAY